MTNARGVTRGRSDRRTSHRWDSGLSARAVCSTVTDTS